MTKRGVDNGHIVPSRLVELSAKATPGEFFANGDTYDVHARPHGSSFVPDQTLVAKCAVGDKAGSNAAFVAAAVNYVRMLIEMPAGQEAHILLAIAEEDARDQALFALEASGDEAASALARASGSMLPHERRARREDEAMRASNPLTDLDVEAVLKVRSDLTPVQAAILLMLRRHVCASPEELLARAMPDLTDATFILRNLVELRELDLVHGRGSGTWHLELAGEDVVAARDIARVE